MILCKLCFVFGLLTFCVVFLFTLLSLRFCFDPRRWSEVIAQAVLSKRRSIFIESIEVKVENN